MRKPTAIFVAAVMAALPVGAGSAAPRPGALAGPVLARMSGAELTQFTRAMPKGGELHLHLGGSVYPETQLKWAAEDGACIDLKALAIRPPCQPTDELKPAAEALRDETVRSAMIDSLSVRHPGFMGRSGHDQFFTAFQRSWWAPARQGDALAETMDRLAGENAFYLEAMMTPQGAAATAIGRQVGWRQDLPALKAAMSAAGLDDLAAQASADTDAILARARQSLACETPQARPGCAVTVRFLAQASRAASLPETFAQLQLGAALVAKDSRWVGVQLVAPEDAAPAIANYRQHMRMAAFLTGHGQTTPLALHAGELGQDIATPADLADHVAQAVQDAGARRIGHAADIAHEQGAAALTREMAAKGVLVEINLSSNASILGLTGSEHPYGWLRSRGVPTALSTDDPGILKIDLSHEYARAAREGASYADLKISARNAIAFSFLKGQGLWRDPGRYRLAEPACARAMGAEMPPPGPCASLVARSDKAREQWRLERLLRRFEAGR
jgi:adenosine deaminase